MSGYRRIGGVALTSRVGSGKRGGATRGPAFSCQRGRRAAKAKIGRLQGLQNALVEVGASDPRERLKGRALHADIRIVQKVLERRPSLVGRQPRQNGREVGANRPVLVALQAG